MKLQGKTALITGASKRIGRDIALTLARSGAHIVIHYASSKPEAESLKKKIESLRVKAWTVRADFSHSPKLIERVVEPFIQEVYQKARRIDVLINNASVFYPTPFEEIRERDWDDFLSVNLKAPFFLSQAVGMKMKKQKTGKIVNLADWTAERPRRNFLPYCISKAGLVTATEGLAKILAPYVQVNAIAPGPILPFAAMTAREKKRVTEATLLKRFGHPRDIAETVRYLVEKTDYVTGAVIPVDGGSHLNA